MSDLSTASSALKMGGGIASVIPVYGQAIGAGLSAIGGIMDMVDADKQKSEAERLQKEAEKVKKKAPEKEYLQALRAYKMMAQGGMPGYENAKQDVDLGAANALTSIREASPYGGSVADAINAVLNKGAQVKSDLAVKDAEFKLDARNKVVGQLNYLGDKQRDLTKEARERQEALYSQAGDMLAASTANRQIGREKALSAGIMGVGALAKGIGGIDGGSESTTTDASSAGLGAAQIAQALKSNPSLWAEILKLSGQ